MKTGPLLLAILSLTGACTNAAVILSENFDGGTLVSPKWVVASGNASAVDTRSVSPSYSAQLQGSNTWLYTRGFTALPTSTTTDKIELSFDVQFDSGGIYSRVVTLQNNAVNATLAGLRVNANGQFQLHNSAATVIGNYQADTWYHISFILSLQERTYDITISEVGGASVGSLSGIEFHSTSATNLGTIYFYNDPSNQTTFIDNVVLQSIPEPGALSLLALSGAAAIWGGRRRYLKLERPSR